MEKVGRGFYHSINSGHKACFWPSAISREAKRGAGTIMTEAPDPANS